MLICHCTSISCGHQRNWKKAEEDAEYYFKQTTSKREERENLVFKARLLFTQPDTLTAGPGQNNWSLDVVPFSLHWLLQWTEILGVHCQRIVDQIKLNNMSLGRFSFTTGCTVDDWVVGSSCSNLSNRSVSIIMGEEDGIDLIRRLSIIWVRPVWTVGSSMLFISTRC